MVKLPNEAVTESLFFALEAEKLGLFEDFVWCLASTSEVSDSVRDSERQRASRNKSILRTSYFDTKKIVFSRVENCFTI